MNCELIKTATFNSSKPWENFFVLCRYLNTIAGPKRHHEPSNKDKISAPIHKSCMFEITDERRLEKILRKIIYAKFIRTEKRFRAKNDPHTNFRIFFVNLTQGFDSTQIHVRKRRAIDYYGKQRIDFIFCVTR
uniref:Uncharacterized protein n=1 Tax=Romanomermis culicivorax TaxID=13658 RepID=A0A915KMK5_ROMCU